MMVGALLALFLAVFGLVGGTVPGVDWDSLLSRHALTWEWDEHASTWPSVFQLAAFGGNGLYGVTAMVHADGNSMRFDVARTDVYNCGVYPRMSIGSVQLRWSKGQMEGGRMVQDMHKAVINGTVKTTKGEVHFAAWVPAVGNVIAVEWSVAGAEEAEITFVPMHQDNAERPAVPGLPPVRCHGGSNSSTGDAGTVCTQPLTCGSYSTALVTAVHGK